MDIRIYLAGRLCLEADGELAIDERQFRRRQSRLVFAYLALRRNTAVAREELAEAVWSEDLSPSWETSLSALVSGVRGLLSAPRLAGSGITLTRGSGHYELALPGSVFVDVEAAATAIDQAEDVLQRGEPLRVLGPASVAANICRRPFLSGIEGPWVESQRRRFERHLLRALDCLSIMWLERGESDRAVETATEAVEADPFRESSYRLLMRAYGVGGNAPKAAGVYRRLRELLTRELDTVPTAETEALYNELVG